MENKNEEEEIENSTYKDCEIHKSPSGRIDVGEFTIQSKTESVEQLSEVAIKLFKDKSILNYLNEQRAKMPRYVG